MPLYSLNGETASIMTLAPVIPVLTVASVEDGVAQAKALVAGGLYAIEVTLRTPSALSAIRKIAESVPGAVVGAGTIVSVDQIGEAVAAGARFLVSPGASAALARAAAQSPVPFLPGCATASEAMALRELGLPRAEALSRRSGGRREAARIACRGLSPICASARPAASISPRRPRYLKLPNVPCVGGSWMLQKAALAAGEYSAVEKPCRGTQPNSSARPSSIRRPTPPRLAPLSASWRSRPSVRAPAERSPTVALAGNRRARRDAPPSATKTPRRASAPSAPANRRSA